MSSSTKVQQIRFKTFLKATGTNRKAFFASGAGLDPLLEAKDIERISAGLGKYGKTAQSETARLPMELLNEVLSFVTPPQMAVLNAAAFPTSRSITTLERCMDISHGVLYLITENPSFKKPLVPAEKNKKDKELTSPERKEETGAPGEEKEEEAPSSCLRKDILALRGLLLSDPTVTESELAKEGVFSPMPTRSAEILEKHLGGPGLPKFMAALGTHPENGLTTDRAEIIHRYVAAKTLPSEAATSERKGVLWKEQALVIRDGVREGRLIPWAEVVPGDLLLLKPRPEPNAPSASRADNTEDEDVDRENLTEEAFDLEWRHRRGTENCILADCYLLDGDLLVELSELTGELAGIPVSSEFDEQRTVAAGARMINHDRAARSNATTSAIVFRTGTSTSLGSYGMFKGLR